MPFGPSKFEDINMDLFRKTLDPVKQGAQGQWHRQEGRQPDSIGGWLDRIPKVQEILSQYFNGKELNKEINPDEAVAYGAAVQGAILSGSSGRCPRTSCFWMCTLSLDIETAGGVMTKLVTRGTTIPAKKTQVFSTCAETSLVWIQVFEGERSMTKDNRVLGSFQLDQPPPAPRGVPQIEVSFDVDNGSTGFCRGQGLWQVAKNHYHLGQRTPL